MEVSKYFLNHLIKIKHTKFLIPFSIFSVILSYLTFLVLILQVSIQIDKNYMFLICNGILVLIAKNSGFISSCGTGEKTTTRVQFKTGHEVKIVNKNIDQPKLVVEEISSPGLVAQDNNINKVVPLVINGEDHDEDGVINFESFEDESDQLQSIEELNKRCEEFIRKMKAEIMFEA